MKLNYTIIDALAFLKYQIEDLEKKMKKETKLERIQTETLIVWYLERGLKMMQYADPKVSKATKDYFLGKIKGRPDITRLNELLSKEKR